MKKLALFSMLLGLGLFTLGCGETKKPPVKPAATSTDTSTTDEGKPADGTGSDEMPEDKPADDAAAPEEKPADDEPAGEEKPADEKPADEKAPE